MRFQFDEIFLRRALRVAMNGRGRVEPNPMVGCTLVRDGQVIAEGHHSHFGGPHAEPTALVDCFARGHDPRGATAYVTLEPCCHTNKKTPPCAPRLIEAGIARVVIGCLDPNPDVNGKGVASLRASGVAVDLATPALAAECLQLIAPFRTPPFYTTIKWAQSADGFVAGPGGAAVRITRAQADCVVHRLRTRSDAIVIGGNTAVNDDPSLTIRGVEMIRHPARIVLDRRLRLPTTAKLLTTASPSVTGQALYVVTRAAHLKPVQIGAQLDVGEMTAGNASAIAAIASLGAEVIGVEDDAGDVRARIRAVALRCPMTHVIIEPGPTLAAADVTVGGPPVGIHVGRAF